MKPFVAMINNAFNKKGKRGALHGSTVCRYCVVYEDKSLWGIPLIDIYDTYDNSHQAETALNELLSKEAAE